MSGDDIRDSAWERIADKPSMVIADGDPIEELAKAHERHAEALDRIVETLRNIGRDELLGHTAEGVPAMANIREAVWNNPRSLRSNYHAEAANSRLIAEQLRENGRVIMRTETENAAELGSALPR